MYNGPISYPESSGFLVSGATPGRLWGHRKNSIFLIGCSVTVSIVLPQKSCGNKIRCPQSLPSVAPLTKKPEGSGYEIDNGRAALSCWLNLFPTENYFTAATKRVISSMQSCTKKIFKRKGKDSGEIVPYPVNIDEHCS